IAHQWRQPLTSLSLLLDDLRLRIDEGERVETTELSEYVQDAQHLIQHMSGTVNDFRSIYQESPESRSIRLRAVVDQALSIADGTLKASGIAVEIDDQNPDVVLLARPNELCHVLLNLVSNAQAVVVEREVATPRITIRLSTEPGVHVIEVEDNGGGVDPAIAPRLFEPFATSRTAGTGLGLYMSRRLVVERFGGRLERCEGKHGACFRIELPCSAPQ
ncbi:MAG: ATP-binding protein, partial [Nannocystaceae bacterium]